ncbi:aminoglycoside 6-adenylyltransferase [Paenibacillus humicola]|uniref:aminoglycoside 6-adenylyltransferase n=1 Tax=Paenibacillus humicola TaxID=3110540 RepID=UPI00237AC822|nr:aminoglycoside 6-adenylyltransferase [Paenibacillus humicola]
MRSEQEMLRLIVDFAREDERIRAVIMNGSRVNPDAPRDFFQDYDIVYIVAEVAPFVRDREWVRRFGDMMIMQTPDEMDEPSIAPEERTSFAYLMQFADGNRIDLTLFAKSALPRLGRDSLSRLLLDKDGCIEPFPEPHRGDYAVKPPSAADFANCCNEFWWVSTYIAKGLWRRELPYAKAMFEGPVRAMLIRMLEWHIGVSSDFTADSGKNVKYAEKHLAPELWRRLLRTYPDGDYEHMWASLFAMGELFRDLAADVGNRFGYAYPEEDDRKVTAHLKHVHALPRDAAVMYE